MAQIFSKLNQCISPSMVLEIWYKMNANLPNKSSSRAGRFKKKLVSEDSLMTEAPIIELRLKSILENFHQGTISAAEFTAIYILSVLAYRNPGTWLGAKRHEAVIADHHLPYALENLLPSFEPNIQKRLNGFKTIGEVFQFFAFKATPLSVNRSILGWSTGKYGLELMFRIPRPAEVLNQQKQGRRCVTVVLEKEKAAKFILGERDALGFTMHDLIHADHFYHNNFTYQGQLGFYGFLDHCMNQQHFDDLLKIEKFESEFEYLIADMNAYAIHLMKCFKSALLHYHPQGVVFYEQWLKHFNLSAEEKDAFDTLNSEAYSGPKDQILLNFLDTYRAKTPLTI